MFTALQVFYIMVTGFVLALSAIHVSYTYSWRLEFRLRALSTLTFVGILALFINGLVIITYAISSTILHSTVGVVVLAITWINSLVFSKQENLELIVLAYTMLAFVIINFFLGISSF